MMNIDNFNTIVLKINNQEAFLLKCFLYEALKKDYPELSVKCTETVKDLVDGLESKGI